ncbi:kinesin light chain 1 [Ophiobolus disseminans]|uniref:Kinesin light chain 1 n=1 Tax=Ophiobolus disseminans TaxID=1469910 RepID=A0A6A7ADV9_9PLEO|nr:kinesin light chain 1 [Ophiobolus disseminans]
MRLLQRLKDDVFELATFDDESPSPYAILSHTWIEGQEVTYDELVAGGSKNKSGYAKLRFCAEQAAADGIQYIWVDTCCIDKSTSNELSTAINSMFRWYQRAAKCYVYLSDVSVPEEVADAHAFPLIWTEAFQRSRWFTRGWTLQELLAPPHVEFFSREGKRLGSRISLEREIHKVANIPVEVLRGQSLAERSVEERMGWAGRRMTTLKEDKVYCLLGIFGVFLPLIYGEGEEYATRRLKEEIARRQKGQGIGDQDRLLVSLLLPFPRNEQFVGREDQLKSLKQMLFSLRTHARMAIYGLGGCGKSALALEFAYRVLADRAADRVFWVPAISRDSFELAYREIATSLCIPGIRDSNADINKLVKEALSADSSGNWLMIVDNADDPTVLQGTVSSDPRSARLSDLLPCSRQGTILFTTRSRKAAWTLSPDCVLELKDMNQAEARQLLVQRVTEDALLDDSLAINRLLSILACLPLAIVQAAAFINSNATSVSEYVSLFEDAGIETELFSEQFEDPSRYQGMDSTIAKTWHISFNQIRRQDPLAADYLAFIACIDRINVPQSLLPSKGSRVQQIKALGTLTGYAFLMERQQTVQGAERERYFDTHRLVHVASVAWLHEHGEWEDWARTATKRLQELVPYGGHERKEIWVPYLPHAIHVAGCEDVVDTTARACLLERVGTCQKDLGQYTAAEASHRQVSSLREEVLGPEHPDTLTSMSNLALVLNSQGKYKEAEAMNRQTLAWREKVLGPKHPDTLTSLSNLARVMDSQGKYEEAEAMNRQELECTKKKVLGPEHPYTLTSMSNLAQVLNSQGKYKEAEAMNRQTLARREKVLGPEQPDTLTSVY